jgi:hypothetical protein
MCKDCRLKAAVELARLGQRQEQKLGQELGEELRRTTEQEHDV